MPAGRGGPAGAGGAEGAEDAEGAKDAEGAEFSPIVPATTPPLQKFIERVSPVWLKRRGSSERGSVE
jgi:hypothetical protein